MADLTFRNGVAFYNKTPLYLITAEYPYFRDNPANWERRLRQIAALGATIISTYIPWRHHDLQVSGERRYDFSGETLPNRNVLGFIQLCQSLGLKLILKPGPFCHAELNYGGLPDFVCPLQRPDIEANLKADGSPVTWAGSQPDSTGAPQHWPLPSAASPVYQAEVKRWFEVIREQVLLENCAPKGPMVAVQVGNEGIYSDAQHAIWSHDYSTQALQAYRTWLKKRYVSIDNYNKAHQTIKSNWSEIEPPCHFVAPTNLAGLAAYTDWSEYSGYSLGCLYSEYAAGLALPVPALVNINPPTGDKWGIDAWLSRVQPEKWSGVHYGYTNWIGVAAEDPSALARYMLLTRRAAGPNLEENWGFGKIYDPRYEKASVCFQQTLAAIAGGATGYNIYTAVGTTEWIEEIDRFMEKPYPSHAPIGPVRVDPEKVAVLSNLNEFLNKFGGEYLSCVPVTEIGWGLYQPYAHLGAWLGQIDGDGEKAGEVLVEGHSLNAQGPAILAIQQQLLANGVDLGYIDLQNSTAVELGKYKVIVMVGGPYMDPITQQILCQFIQAGGTLLLIGEVPVLDENLAVCQQLAALRQEAEANFLTYSTLEEALAELPTKLIANKELLENVITIDAPGQAYAWRRVQPKLTVEFIVLLSNLTGEVKLSYSDKGNLNELSLELPSHGGVILRLENGKITHSVIGGEL